MRIKFWAFGKPKVGEGYALDWLLTGANRDVDLAFDSEDPYERALHYHHLLATKWRRATMIQGGYA